MVRVLAAALVLLFAACDEPASKPPAAQTKAKAKAAGSTPAAAVRAAMGEMSAYSEKVFAIVRKNGKNCDATAQGLAELAPTFRELGPRMMAVKTQMASLPEAEREAIKREADQLAERFRARIPDMDELERIARECEKSSPAFARVAPQVMFMKKKSSASE